MQLLCNNFKELNLMVPAWSLSSKVYLFKIIHFPGSSSEAMLAIGHGISSSFLDKVREAATQFFELPVEEKEKYSRSVHGGSEGYGNDVIVSEKQVLDWSYRLTPRAGCGVHVRTGLKCARPSVRHRLAPTTVHLHPSRLQQRPRSLSLPSESAEFQFPARSTLFEVLGDLARKLEKNGLTGEGKWSGALLESSGVEARRRRRRTVANGGLCALSGQRARRVAWIRVLLCRVMGTFFSAGFCVWASTRFLAQVCSSVFLISTDKEEEPYIFEAAVHSSKP
ncbi:hypothetical protein ACLB2K_072280 [Fragaria x ananassa]